MANELNNLRDDNAQLYFLLGALTDAIEQLPADGYQQILATLQRKAQNTDGACRDSLDTLIEALQWQRA